MTATWGEPVRVRYGRLTHHAGPDRGGMRLLACGVLRWPADCLPPRDGARVCRACEFALPGLARQAAMTAEVTQGGSVGDRAAPDRAQNAAGATESAEQGAAGVPGPPKRSEGLSKPSGGVG